VGAPGENSNHGRAYLFSVASPTAALLKTIVPPSAQWSEWGSSVALNWTSSRTTAVIGAPGSSLLPGLQTGGVYVYSSNVALTQILLSPNPVFQGGFGAAVAMNGATVVVGAPDETAFGTLNTGNIYLFDATSGALRDRYNDPSVASGELFGSSVAIALNGAVAVGAPAEYATTYSGVEWTFFL
jgi:hypothetical protein